MNKTQSLPTEHRLPSGGNGPKNHMKSASTEKEELSLLQCEDFPEALTPQQPGSASKRLQAVRLSLAPI